METNTIIILLIIAYILYHHPIIDSMLNRKKVCTDVDGRCYEISNSFDKESFEKASNKLGYLNNFAIEFLRKLRTKFLLNRHGTDIERGRVLRLIKNYNPENLFENNPKGSINTSYVKNKGDEFAVCLREKNTGKHNFHKYHTLEFVFIHELSHLADLNYQHGKTFWESFKFLLTQAKLFGMHEPINYAVNPVVYCSLKIDYNPYYDNNI